MHLRTSTITLLCSIGISITSVQANNDPNNDTLIALLAFDVGATVLLVRSLISRRASQPELNKLPSYQATINAQISQLANHSPGSIEESEKNFYAAGIDHASTIRSLNVDKPTLVKITSEQQAITKGLLTEVTKIRGLLSDALRSRSTKPVTKKLTTLRAEVRKIGEAVSSQIMRQRTLFL